MPYQGTADLAEMAKDVSERLINGGWSDVIALIKELNGLQALYLMNEILECEYLTKNDIGRLARIAIDHMNDDESGEGYISLLQDDSDEEE